MVCFCGGGGGDDEESSAAEVKLRLKLSILLILEVIHFDIELNCLSYGFKLCRRCHTFLLIMEIQKYMWYILLFRNNLLYKITMWLGVAFPKAQKSTLSSFPHSALLRNRGSIFLEVASMMSCLHDDL